MRTWFCELHGGQTRLRRDVTYSQLLMTTREARAATQPPSARKSATINGKGVQISKKGVQPT
jgi:hypothetical protein